ncbi:MAG: GNAT family N-acetyltransferase [Bacteroidetes bacterium]|nr:GNAT family N-acetyltransferase [Bacteroidota bacterium]
MTPTLLTDKSRLQEIYDLRVTAYESSPKSIYVNRNTFPNGWFDHLDPLEETLHWIIEQENKIIASARLAILQDLKDTNEDFDKFELPPDRPFAYWSRLVIHPSYRRSSAKAVLDNVRLKYIRDNQEIKFALCCASQDRWNSLLSLGFRYLGDFMFNWDGKAEQKIGAFILLNSKV